MPKPKFIADREELEKLAPMLRAPIKRQVFVCTGKSCNAVGAQDVRDEFHGSSKKKASAKAKNPKAATQWARSS